jgi:GNAT superfamily N-acetyltransferase
MLGMASIEIRRARPGEAGLLTQIAQDAKQHWGYSQDLMRTWLDVLTVTAEFLQTNEVHVLSAEGEIAGFYALLGHAPELRMEHLWVMPRFMKQGHGRRLFQHACELARSLKAKRLLIEADPNAEGFYLAMGATPAGQNVYETQGTRRVLPELIIQLGETPAPAQPSSPLDL